MRNYLHSIFKKFCSTSLLFLLIQINAFATDYYLDPNGNDNNNGTSQATAWQTLNKVNNTNFLPGDRLLLKAGSIWDGQLWPKGSGADSSPIIIDQYGTGNKPIINGQGTNYPQTLVSGAVMLYNQSYWEINNLEVTNYSTTVTSARAGILIISVSSTTQNHIYIKDCYVHDVNSDVNGNKNTGGIIFFGSSTDKDGNSINVNSGFNDVLVENCRVFNVTKEGIRNKSDNRGAYPRVNSNIVFRNNHIEQVFGDGIVLAEIFKGGLVEYNFVKNVATTNSANYAGIWTHYSTGSIIQFNEVCDMTGGYNDGEAFDADNNCDGDIFQYNYSHNNTGGFFLMMPSAKNIIIRYNISQNDGNGKELFHYTSNTYTSNYIYNNTFYIGTGKSTTLFKDGNATRTVKFFNNIIKVDGTITKFADNPFSASSYFANNCFYPANITAINGPSSHPGVINQDPKLIDPITTTYGLNNIEGFKLQAGSPLINAGININNNGGRDYINTPLYISNQADVGAIEYPIITSVPPAPSLGGLVPVADAYVRNGTYANDNFGNYGTLSVKKDATSYERETFLKFDLSTLTEPPTAGKLKLYIDGGDATVASNVWKIYYVANDNWQENNITWNNKPSSETTELASVNGAAAGNTITFDILNQLLSEYNGDKVISLKIVSTTSGSTTNVEFASKENPIPYTVPILITTAPAPPANNQNFIFWQDFDSSTNESDYIFNSGTGTVANTKNSRFTATPKNGSYINNVDVADGYKIVRPTGATGQSVAYITDLAFPDPSNVVAVLQFDLKIEHPSTSANFGLSSGTPFLINFGSGYNMVYDDQNDKAFTSVNFFFPTAGGNNYQIKHGSTAKGNIYSGKNKVTIVVNKTANDVSFTDAKGNLRTLNPGKYIVSFLKPDNSLETITDISPDPANSSINISAIRFRTAATWTGYVALDNIAVSYIPADGTGQVLPLTLESFTAKTNASSVTLKWITKSENNVSHFNITKSIDGNIFSKIGEVKALGKPNTYFYTDFHPAKGVNYYQLISQDYDGKIQKSDVIDAKLTTTNLSLNINKISGDIVNLAIEIPQATVASIVIADMMGKKVGELNTQLTPGTNTISVPSKAKGLLIASLFTPVANISKKFIKL